MGAMAWRRRAGALALPLLFNGALGQLFQFESTPMPTARTLHGLYLYYVYNTSDAAKYSAGAFQPVIEFKDLTAKPDPGKDVPKTEYGALQATVMPVNDFWKGVDPTAFCAASSPTDFHIKFKDKEWSKEAVTFSVPLGSKPKPDYQVPINSTGVYILVVSNCGEFSNAIIAGAVGMKNVWGYLPANEFPKLAFYGILSGFYLLLCLIWIGLTCKWKDELISLHYYIAMVIALGTMETILWWVFLNNWNSVGIRSFGLFVATIGSSVVKSAFSYIIVLATALGWGITNAELEGRTLTKVQVLVTFYVTSEYLRECALSFRYSHSISSSSSFMFFTPAKVLDGILFCWIFSALGALKQELSASSQNEKLKLVERLSQVLVFTLTAGLITLVFQCADLAGWMELPWHVQWIFGQGVRHVLFVFVLSAMMFLFAPSAESQRYAYSMQIGQEEDDDKVMAPALDSWAQEELGEDDDAEEEEEPERQPVRTKKTKARPEPDTIGAEDKSRSGKSGKKVAPQAEVDLI